MTEMDHNTLVDLYGRGPVTGGATRWRSED